jgi:hypothetical protein
MGKSERQSAFAAPSAVAEPMADRMADGGKKRRGLVRVLL